MVWFEFFYRETRKKKRKPKKTIVKRKQRIQSKVMKKPKIFTISWPTSRWTISNASPRKFPLQFLLLNSTSCVLQHLCCQLGSVVPALPTLASYAAPACLLVRTGKTLIYVTSSYNTTVITNTKYIIKFMLTIWRKLAKPSTPFYFFHRVKE